MKALGYEIGDNFYFLIVDENKWPAKSESMSVVIRLVPDTFDKRSLEHSMRLIHLIHAILLYFKEFIKCSTTVADIYTLM